ncbi:hypothetical protein RCL1_003924 [Eukaryota sp. TZLM3-RCL]
MASETGLPKATVAKIVKEIIPDRMRISATAKDTLVRCCGEFISHLSAKSNDTCLSDSRKLISPDHVFSALQALGFEDFISTCQQALTSYKEHESSKPSLKSRPTQETPEELLAEQKRMFDEAAKASVVNVATISTSSLVKDEEDLDLDDI